MYIDALLKVGAAQAYTAAAVSASSVDLGAAAGLNSPPIRAIGDGTPIGAAFSVGVAASATTVQMEIISADDAALTANVTSHGSLTVTAAAAALGAAFFIEFPPQTPTRRFIGTRVTPAGGAATVTMTSWFTSRGLFAPPTPTNYGKNYVV